MTLTEREVIIFLMHLGDGTISREIERDTVEQINDIQRACGVHGDCHNLDLNPSVDELVEVAKGE